MGLDFRHERPDGHHCPQWAYSGFNRFRTRLAASEGFVLDEMQGFSNGHYFENDYKPGTRSWDEITTALKPLLNHSDADGELTPEECAQVAPRLRKVVAEWPENGTMSDAFDYQNGLRLADCMDICAAGGHTLEFC